MSKVRSENLEVRIAPRLRFPEFREAGGWRTVPLSDFADFIKDRAGSTECIPYTVESGVGLISQQKKLGRTIAGKSYKNYIVLKRNDFAYNKSATKAFPEGFLARYVGTERAAVPNSIFTCFRVDESALSPTYLDYLFRYNLHGRWLRKFIMVGGRAHGSLSVSDDDLMALPVPLPSGRSSLIEQQKIADCLTSLDDVIAAQGRKVEALKAHKRGLMQQLFPREGETIPRRRFPEFRNAPEWEEKPLGDLAMFVTERIDLGALSLSNYISTENLLPDFGGVTSAAKLPSAGSAKRFLRDDILASNIRPYLKKVWKSDRDGGASNDVIIIRPKDPAFKCYLPLFLQNDLFIAYVMKGAKGLKMPRGDVALIADFRIPYSSPSEQQRVADCLSALDIKIAAESQKLGVLKNHKRGLMQQLFPGAEVRS